LGYNVNSLIAGLGIGGIAVALAVQNILGDLFSSFTLLLDKPFQVGDYIVIGADSGTVERIGMKTTRIKSLQGEELIVPNAELTGTRIQNFKKMTKRRVVFLIGITYETPHDKIKKVNDIVASIVNKSEHAELDRVHFKEFGDFSLNFEVVFYVNSSVYAVYMDTRQEINFALKEKFDKEGISFAYPTQTLFVEKV
jgi:small-conductance mechanosensitive channel